MTVQHWNPADGPVSEAALRRKIEGLGFKVNRYAYPVGTYFPPHMHSTDKIDAVVSGRLRIGMGGESVVLEPGDYVYVPKNIEHDAEVVGDEPVLSLDAVRLK